MRSEMLPLHFKNIWMYRKITSFEMYINIFLCKKKKKKLQMKYTCKSYHNLENQNSYSSQMKTTRLLNFNTVMQIFQGFIQRRFYNVHLTFELKVQNKIKRLDKFSLNIHCTFAVRSKRLSSSLRRCCVREHTQGIIIFQTLAESNV